MLRGHIRARVLFLAIVVIWLFVWLWLPNVPRQRAFAPGAHTEVLPIEVELNRQLETETTEELQADPEFLPVDPNKISGTVTDLDGDPIADAEVAVYHPDRGDRKSTSDAQGYFTIGELETDKTYRVSAIAPLYNKGVIESVSPGAREIELTLTKASSMRGKVVDANSGGPFTEFEVAYVPYALDEKTWHRFSIDPSIAWKRVHDENGAFELTGIRSNQPFSVGARTATRGPTFVPSEPIAPGEGIDGFQIPLSAPTFVVFTVKASDGSPVAGAAIHMGQTARQTVNLAETDAEGILRFGGLPAGDSVFVAKHPDHGETHAEASVKEGGETKVELIFPAGGSIEGIVTNLGAPAGGARVLAAIQDSGTYREARTDAAGKFDLVGLPAGNYEVHAILPSVHAGLDSEKQMSSAAEVETGKITFVTLAFQPATASVTVSVTMNGAAVTYAEVRGVVGTEGGDKNFRASSNGDGTYRAESLPSGAVYVEVIANQAGGPLKRALTFTLRDGEDVQHAVDFDAQIGITGKITTLADGEHAEVIVVAGKADADLGKAEELLAVRHMASGVAEVSEDGSFRVEGLEPGDYTVIAVAFNPDDDAGNPLDTMRIAQASVRIASESVEIDLAP